MTTIYLSGPMTGISNYNYPLFNHAAQRLRDHGFGVINPAELDHSGAVHWSDYMRVCIGALVEAEAIALLPGWRESRGACLELSIAMSLGFETVLLNDAFLSSVALECVPCSVLH